MQRSREQALQTVAEVITALIRPHPVRVAIDGRTAAGKTTLADDAALALYRERYAGAFDIYESIGQPKLNAHIVIENGTFARPAVRVQKPVK